MERTDVRSTYKRLGRPTAVAYYGYFGNRSEPIICTVSSVGRYLALTEVGHPDKIISAFGHSRRVWWRPATPVEVSAAVAERQHYGGISAADLWLSASTTAMQ